MKNTVHRIQSALTAVVLAGVLGGFPCVLRAEGLSFGGGAQEQQNSLAAAVEARLNKKQFHEVMRRWTTALPR